MDLNRVNGLTAASRVQSFVIDSAKKDDKDASSLLTMKNLPDLLEETSQDFTMGQNKNDICDVANENQSSDISDKEIIKEVIFFSKDMQKEMESIISKLQSQIYNLISEYKVLKSKNILLEHKVKTMKIDNCCKQCKKKNVRRDSSKCTKIFEPEVPADKQLIASLPSPPRLDPQLLAKISTILSQSENFLKPIEQSLTTLQIKMQKYEINDYENNHQLSEYENESDNSLSSTNFYSI